LNRARSNPDGKFFQPMLATVWENIPYKNKQFPLLLDPKLDGMRMTMTATEAITRKGKPVVTVPHIISELKDFLRANPTIRLDGEIYNHEYREDFNTLMSIARKTKPTAEDLQIAMEKLEYHVYDMYDSKNPDLTAVGRKLWLAANLPISASVRFVKGTLVFNKEEFDEVKHRNIENGYEGTIVRVPGAPYVNKRTKYLMKVKDFITEEYEIIDILPGKGNKSDIAGRILVNHNGTVVGCGIRGSWEYCENILLNKDKLIGLDATVRHFGSTPDGSLRFPVCIDIDRPD